LYSDLKWEGGSFLSDPYPQDSGLFHYNIEGLETGEGLHPLQKAFVEHGAIQCGFCTPGMILSAKACLDENPSPSMEETREPFQETSAGAQVM
jgi:carbon-monoxide dehydrogenase small subunit